MTARANTNVDRTGNRMWSTPPLPARVGVLRAAEDTRHAVRRFGGVAGQAELARALGVSRQRVSKLKRTLGFPQPLPGSPEVWLLGEVQEWNARRGTQH